jgi:hypothetical protein
VRAVAHRDLPDDGRAGGVGGRDHVGIVSAT